jgi:enoyl-CoA hydratase/carnithine racemase
MTEVVLMDVSDGVAVLTLNRPERLNAWTGEMQVAYFNLLEQCAASGEVRAIVVTGAGRGFCAGADMQNLGGMVRTHPGRSVTTTQDPSRSRSASTSL